MYESQLVTETWLIGFETSSYFRIKTLLIFKKQDTNSYFPKSKTSKYNKKYTFSGKLLILKEQTNLKWTKILELFTFYICIYGLISGHSCNVFYCYEVIRVF